MAVGKVGIAVGTLASGWPVGVIVMVVVGAFVGVVVSGV